VEILSKDGLFILSRWGHVLAGVTWIGLLYYFNFVQTPAFAGFEAGARNEATAKLVPRALWWFRFGALLTLLTGLMILFVNPEINGMGDYMKSASGVSISTGMLLAIIMFLNVWLVIWPAQQKVIANAQGVLAGREADPAAAAAARKGACASRTNTFLSIPMLFFMVATSHFVPGHFDTSKGGHRGIYYLIILVIAGAVEAIALSAPPAGKPQAWHIDNHRNTIIGGFALTVIVYLVWEALF
jgi:uncharacterized membrane protein